MKTSLLALAVLASLALLARPAAAVDAPKTAEVYVTARGTSLRLASTGTLTFADSRQPLETEPFILVDPSKKFQTVIGIGAAVTDASADVFAGLPEKAKAAVIKAFFDRKDGIGYSFARTNIASCDFSSATYSYVADNDKSANLISFNIAHDLQNRIPMLKRAFAAAGGELKLFASPWSPPAWMKDNGSVLHGGHLKPEEYQAWAEHYVKFILAYDLEGAHVWGVTIQNEPMASQRWESNIFTAEAERDFLKNYLGPAFEKAGLADRKIIVWDHNRDLMYQRAKTIFEDPEAAKYAYGLGYHWYETWSGGKSLHDNVRRVAEAFPDKPLLFTEGTIESFDPAKLDDWALGERYGREMIADFNEGAAAWTDWNILLDEKGGPNHVGNYCYAALHVDTKTGALHYTDIYEYMGHFSKFVRPGARRVAAAPSREALKTVAFANPDGSVAVVVMNDGDQAIDYRLLVGGRSAEATSLPHSIATVVLR